MFEASFNCEVITPMFLTGADGRTPELRASSIKGAIRFWWRAMNGRLSIEDLRREEAKIFGGAGDDEGKSKVIIRLKAKNLQKNRYPLKREYNFKWRFEPNEKTLNGTHAGIGYLLYSTYLKGNEKAFYKEKTVFEVSLKSKDRSALKQTIAAFWTLSFLGGIGARSRRGAGNFDIIDIEDKDNVVDDTKLEFYLKETEANSIVDWLIKNYKIANDIVNCSKKTDFVCEYSNLSLSRIILSSKSFDSSWVQALNDIGKIYQYFRTKNKKDIFGTSVFGLPRNHVETTDRENYNRRSSPLVIRVLRSNNKYYWLVLRMSGKFLPEHVVLKHGSKTRKPDYSKLDEFWHRLKRGNIEGVLHVPDRLEDLKQRIISILNPSEIILFGSRARGDFNVISDIDIAVVGAKGITAFDEVAGNIDIVDIEKIDENFRKKIAVEGITIWQSD